MALFSWLTAQKTHQLPESEQLWAKIRVMEDSLSSLERKQKSLELEWEQVYDKVTHLMARITKRQKALDRETALSSAAQEAATGENGTTPRGEPSPIGVHSTLQAMRSRFGFGR